MSRYIYYLSRALSVLIILYYIFYFGSGPTPVFSSSPVPHIMSALIVVAIALIAWKIPMMGGVIYLLFGFRYFVMTTDNVAQSYYLFGVFVFTGILFIIEGYLRMKRQESIR
jgi:hypothetical protein